jgi:NADH:ubiquinone oxidoreductase subunit F (NADH-binding)
LLGGQITRDRWSNELLPLVADMGRAIELASICGLGRAVPVPLRTAINYFNEDVNKHLKS